MILFTSVTKKAFNKASLIYLLLTVFLGLFAYVYEQFSFGESSWYMRLMFLVTLSASFVTFLAGQAGLWIHHRLSLLTFNSSIATIVSACLIKGIVEISGRTTNLEIQYWYAALALLAVSLLSGIIFRPYRAS